MYYSQLNAFDTMNGPGVRVSLFVSGCTLRCRGCFNKEAQNFKHGQEYTEDTEATILKTLDSMHHQGLSVLGGDPLEEKNCQTVLNLCSKVKKCLPDKTIWLWTGRTVEEIRANTLYSDLFEVVDVLIEGRFVQELRNPAMQYAGSTNQRIIDCANFRA